MPANSPEAWPPELRPGGYVRLLTRDERRFLFNRGQPHRDDVTWVLSPLCAVVEVGLYSPEHALCHPRYRHKLDPCTCCPELAAEGCAVVGLWDLVTEILSASSGAVEHASSIEPEVFTVALPRHWDTVERLRDIARAVRARKVALDVLNEIEAAQ